MEVPSSPQFSRVGDFKEESILVVQSYCSFVRGSSCNDAQFVQARGSCCVFVCWFGRLLKISFASKSV